MDIFNTLANAIRPEKPSMHDVFILMRPFGLIAMGSILYKHLKTYPYKYSDITTEMSSGDTVFEYDIPDNYLQPASKALSEKVHLFISQVESERADEDADRIDETNYYLTNSGEC